MLDASSSSCYHALQNLALICISLIFLPLDTLVLVFSLSSNIVVPPSMFSCRDTKRKPSQFKQRNVLVTGVGMSKGLTLARLFYEGGHRVIGADFTPSACGRVSKSLTAFHVLQRPASQLRSSSYTESLLDIVWKEKIDLWVSCSGVASAVEDGEAKEIIEARTTCKAIQFDVETTRMLHEKHTFIEHTRDLGFTVPETHLISSIEQASSILRNAGSRMYIMKPVGVDDANRGDMRLLPGPTAKETEEHLSKLGISRKTPWILQQFIRGPEYCTHALIINGSVEAFVACPSAELLMHYKALPAESKLRQQMLDFTCNFAGKQSRGFTGHLSFDFLVSRHEDDSPDSYNASEKAIYPIECNPRAHTAVVLFNGTPTLVHRYLSILESSEPGQRDITVKNKPQMNAMPVVPRRNDMYFWIGHDLVTLLLLPSISFLTFQPLESVLQLVRNVAVLSDHILFWYDGTYQRWDPLPWWWLYHVYWPMQFWKALRTGNKWSRINVSTTKIFSC